MARFARGAEVSQLFTDAGIIPNAASRSRITGNVLL
jgi:hypothetical protein